MAASQSAPARPDGRLAPSELERAEAELAQLVFAVSHDLTEPLRAVSGYLDLLSSTCEGRLGEEGELYVANALAAGERMRELMADLVAYARLGRAPLSPERVDVADVVADALETLRDSVEQARATIRVGTLPTVVADRSQLEQLVEHLLDNALKFRRGAAVAIDVRAEHVGDEWLFVVTDDGIGIEARYRARVFEVFRRLHGRTAFTGTGVGLAVCKLVVERHGGRIWIDDPADGGTALCFTIPARGTG